MGDMSLEYKLLTMICLSFGYFTTTAVTITTTTTTPSTSKLHQCEQPPQDLRNIDNVDYVIGGMVPVHFYKSSKKRFLLNSPGVTWVESMLFAIDEINNRTDLLPNITLGYRIFDSCNTVNTAIEGVLQLLNGVSNSANNSNICPCETPASTIIGLVGDAASRTTTKVASIMSASKTPQISYSATSTELSDKSLFPSFRRTIPPDNFQAILITDLMLHYKWTFVNIVASDDSYGRVGVDELLPAFKRHNICVQILDVFDIEKDDGTYIKNVVKKLKNEKQATVIILWCQRPEALKILKAAEEEQLYDKTWIATETYGSSTDLYNYNSRLTTGLLGIIPAQNMYKPFEDRLKTITPNSSNKNPWLGKYWEKLGCNKTKNSTKTYYTCPENVKDATKLPPNKYVNVIDSIYAIAHALDKYLRDRGSIRGTSIDVKILDQYVKSVNFVGKGKTNVSFNAEGNPNEATYTIVNLQYNKSTKRFKHEKVANWNYLKRRITMIDFQRVQFAGDTDIPPKSSCAEHCSPGYYGLSFGDKPCCWKCVKCPDGKIQPKPGRLMCIDCPKGTIPNNPKTKCLKPTMVYLNPDSTVGSVIIVFTIIGYLLVLTCVIIFFINRNTPIVKASNRALSFIQLSSILFQLAIPAFYFQKTFTTTLCASSLFYFLVFNTITVSITFTKADRLLQVFRASQRGILAKHKRAKGNTIQYFKVFLLTAIGLLVCTTTYIIFKPSAAQKEIFDGDHVYVQSQCGGYYDSIRFAVVGYVVFIGLVCSVYAFKARKLPQDYNEARFTSFAMFTFIIIWVMAIPIFFSRKNTIEKSACWCLLNFLSTIAIFVPMYSSKIRIILLKPEENTRKRFREKLKEDAVRKFNSDSTSTLACVGAVETPLDSQNSTSTSSTVQETK